MWILFAFLSALFAGITAILAKCGIKDTDATAATAIRTVVVLIMSFIVAAAAGSLETVFAIEARTWGFLILSGLATGASWLCYFKALQLGEINKVVPVDKASVILTMLFAFIFLKESISWGKGICIVLIAVGTYLMLGRKPSQQKEEGKSWLLYAIGSAVFAALTTILGKIGIEGVESNLGTAIRTAVVLVMAWFMVFVTGGASRLKKTPKRELVFICLSGLATGASWLCYFKALQSGPASIIVPIDKLSILVTVTFSYFVFHEKLSGKSAFGLILITAGTLGMLV